MLSWRWGGAVCSLAIVAGVAVLWHRASGHDEVDAHPQPRPQPERVGHVLVGTVHASGVSLERCEVRCTAMRFDSTPEVHRAAVDPSGRFELVGLEDADYRVEIVLRSNPSMVLASAEYVRPDREELLMTYDPSQLFGPAGKKNQE